MRQVLAGIEGKKDIRASTGNTWMGFALVTSIGISGLLLFIWPFLFVLSCMAFMSHGSDCVPEQSAWWLTLWCYPVVVFVAAWFPSGERPSWNVVVSKFSVAVGAFALVIHLIVAILQFDSRYENDIFETHQRELIRAVIRGDADFVEDYIAQGNQITFAGSKRGINPLWVAVAANQLHIADLLLKSGIDVNLKPLDSRYFAPSFILIENAEPRDPAEKLQWLIRFLEAGLDPNIEVDGLSLLHFAVYSGITDAVKLFLQKGVDVNRKDNQKDGSGKVMGRTPFEIAVSTDEWSIAHLLFDRVSGDGLARAFEILQEQESQANTMTVHVRNVTFTPEREAFRKRLEEAMKEQ